MRARTAFLIALLTLSLGRSTQAQEVMPRPVSPELLPAPRTGGGPDSAPTHIYASDSGHGGLSDWITYRHRSCWSNDWDPHVVTELYLRSGVDFPFPGDVLGRILSPGWSITGGGKAIFFDKSYTRAWFADISLGNTFNESNNAAPFNPITLVPGQVGRVRDYNRTCVGLGLGREWYLMGDGSHCNGPSWRVSFDGGGRWGSASVAFDSLKHTSDVIGAVYFGLETDYEWPMQCAPCTFVFGLRAEWDYTWSDILEQRSDVQDLSILFHFGVRF